MCKSPCLYLVFIYYRSCWPRSKKIQKNPLYTFPSLPQREHVAEMLTHSVTGIGVAAALLGVLGVRVCGALCRASSVRVTCPPPQSRRGWLQYRRDPALPFGTRPASIPPAPDAPSPRPALHFSGFITIRVIRGRDRGVAFPPSTVS